MSNTAISAQKRLGVWAETPDRHKHVQLRLGSYRKSSVALTVLGQELAHAIVGESLDGLIFYSDNVPLVRTAVALMESQCPACARFVVCDPKTEAQFRTWENVDVPPALLKESEPSEIWVHRLERALLLHRWLMQPQFRMILPRLRTIPTLPDNHNRVLQALRSPDFEIDDVAKLISRDVALTAQLLKIVNSAALGLAEPVHSISTAIGVLGVSRLQSLVISAWAFFFADEKMCKGFSPALEWQHALQVAELSQKLARDRGAKRDEIETAFIAGILHDIGKILLAANAPGNYASIIAMAKAKGQPLYVVEKEVLGYSHAEVGACVLGLWGLDIPIVEAVWRHDDPDLPNTPDLFVARIIQEANASLRAASDTAHLRKPQPPQ